MKCPKGTEYVPTVKIRKETRRSSGEGNLERTYNLGFGGRYIGIPARDVHNEIIFVSKTLILSDVGLNLSFTKEIKTSLYQDVYVWKLDTLFCEGSTILRKKSEIFDEVRKVVPFPEETLRVTTLRL